MPLSENVAERYGSWRVEFRFEQRWRLTRVLQSLLRWAIVSVQSTGDCERCSSRGSADVRGRDAAGALCARSRVQ
jgi:hypothetical protein